MTASWRPLPESIGRYRIESLLGKGGMGEVYRAFDPALDRTVALKTIASSSDEQLLLERLYQEARACGRLRHPNIVTVYDLHEAEGMVCIAMEYLEGESLGAALRRGALSITEKLTVLTQVLGALEYAHSQGVIHRDIKPTNVHLLPDKTVKLLDFGLARMTMGDSMTVTGSVMGTPYYMSPEQLKGQRVDERSDIYSAGVLAYELLTGRKAFDGENITAVMLKVLSESAAPMDTSSIGMPPDIERIVARAMAKAPADRYARASEMRDAVAALIPAISEATAGLESLAFAAAPSVEQTVLAPRRSAASSQPSSAGELRQGREAVEALLAGVPPQERRPAGSSQPSSQPRRSESGIQRFVTRPYAGMWVGVGAVVLMLSLVLWATAEPDVSPRVTRERRQPTPSADPAPQPDPSPRPLDVSRPALPDSDVRDVGLEPTVTGRASTGQAALTPSSSTQGEVSIRQVPSPPPARGQVPPTRGQAISALTNTDLSRALVTRLGDVLREKGISPRGDVRVSLEMSTRPSPFQGTKALTADYLVSVRGPAVTRTIEGRALEFSELALKNTVIDKAAADVAAVLSESPQP